MNRKNRVHQSALQPLSGHWLHGFYPIYQKELAYWFGTSRWISQLILWLSLTAIPAIWMTPSSANDRGLSYLTLFLWFGSTLLSLGTIILAQGTIIEEKLTQTLPWIGSKPLSSAGFILAKFSAYAVLLGTLALAAPALFLYVRLCENCKHTVRMIYREKVFPTVCDPCPISREATIIPSCNFHRP